MISSFGVGVRVATGNLTVFKVKVSKSGHSVSSGVLFSKKPNPTIWVLLTEWPTVAGAGGDTKPIHSYTATADYLRRFQSTGDRSLRPWNHVHHHRHAATLLRSGPHSGPAPSTLYDNRGWFLQHHTAHQSSGATRRRTLLRCATVQGIRHILLLATNFRLTVFLVFRENVLCRWPSECTDRWNCPKIDSFI